MALILEAFLLISCLLTCTAISEHVVPCLTALVNRNGATFAHQVNLFGQDLSSYADRDLLDGLLLGMDSRITVNIAAYNELRDFNHRQLVIWMVDTMEKFEQDFDSVRNMNLDFRGHFVLLLRGEFVWKEILERFWDIGVTNVIMLLAVAQGEGVAVVGYEPFQGDCCQCVAPKVVDRCVAGVYDEGIDGILFDNYVRNLQGCSLKIATFTRLPFIEVVENSRRRKVLHGVEGDMLATISRKMNFSIEVRVPTGDDVWGQIFANGSGVGAVGMVVRDEVDCTIGGFVPYPELIQFTSPSMGYHKTDFVFVVPEEFAEISSLNQITNPLGKWIWVAMVVVFGMTYLVIVSSNYPLVGHFSDTPALTMYRTTLGDSLPNLPRGNFFRFLMFLFLYYNLVIRESYKCSMISHLTKKRHLNDISSLKTMISAGYRFVLTYPLYNLLFKDTLQLDEEVILLKDDEYIRGLVQVIRERRRIALISIPEEIVDFNHRHPKWVNFRVCEESLMGFHYSVYFKRSSPMLHEFNRLLQRLLTGGLMGKWHSTLMNRRYQATTLNDEPATVLTNGHLFSGYVILAVGLGVGVLAFLLEVVSTRSAWIRKYSPGTQRYSV